ncbi:glycosyltransferase family 4 protein [Paenibacillus sp. NPDC056722]|uniref:glycosyltransferase family 4 protein n=1 Tax=Paenibacillus sp. NPDC056722 TaxID=3345924 RepID=UPI003686049C
MENLKSKKIPTVLFVFHNSDYYSGATRSLIDIIESYLDKKTVNIVTLFPKTEGTAIDYLLRKDIKVINCFYTELVASINQPLIKKIVAFPYRFARMLISIISIYRLKSLISDLKFDAVYTNTSVIFVGGFLNKFFKIPHIWHFREFRREDQQIDFFFGEKYFYKFANKYANKIIVLSKSMFQKNQLYIKPEKLQVIYNDISPSYINPKKKFNLSKSNIQLLIAGTLSEGKGQLEALKALKILLDGGYEITLNIAGNTDCEYYKILEDYVFDNNMSENVIFHGLRKDMNELRKSMDIGLVTSKSEAFGRVTVEGMLSSLAMIGQNSAGTSELIKNNETGLLYEPGNIEALAENIKYLYESRSEMERISVNGYNYAVDNFTKGKCSNTVLELVLEALNEPNYI